MARVQPNGTQIAPNCSKPGLEKWEWDVRHAMWCTVNIWSKLMKGRSLPGSLFLDVHRGETVPSLALKLNFLLQTTAHWPVCLPGPTYHVLYSKHTPTVQVHSVSNQGLFSFHAIAKNDLIINVSQFLHSHLSASYTWQQKYCQTSEKKKTCQLPELDTEGEGEIRSAQDSCDDKCKRQNIPITNSISNCSVSGNNHSEEISLSFHSIDTSSQKVINSEAANKETGFIDNTLYPSFMLY